ncbi:uncharacterized protein LOC133843829 isoform X1 [Drosophila sulfurigaster albostrigata]|uniref:uncharacterized protein LOC133843829 isoform X1 n=1 Tax=Drosophila sulfurigaster albostrigata TaxID=89887 RepID=UPI002D21B5F6|nr:uncharacterized protein LOC133843829 isoform X1 [Drosophila sulfurigaster albostrigata]
MLNAANRHDKSFTHSFLVECYADQPIGSNNLHQIIQIPVATMSSSVGVGDESIVQQLKNSVAAIVAKTGPNSKFAEDLMQKINRLQTKMESLTESDRHAFVSEMKGSFQEAIARIERRLVTHTNFAQTYSTSILVAVIFLIVSVFALFGYKLYKSLTEKELKKQEKLKSKQQKKAKKSN